MYKICVMSNVTGKVFYKEYDSLYLAEEYRRRVRYSKKYRVIGFIKNS